MERKNLMQNIVGLQDRLVKAAAAVGRGALPVLASGLQSRNETSPRIVGNLKFIYLTLLEILPVTLFLRMRS